MKLTCAVCICFLLSLLLAGCGPVEVFLEPGPLNGPTPAPSPTLAPTATPVPTATPEPTPIVALTGLLPGGLPLTIIQTRMLSSQAGWAVARVDSDLYDHLMLTADGGKTWKDRTPQGALTDSPPEGLVVTAFFASSQLAWAAYSAGGQSGSGVSPLIWRTIDGGQSWAASQPLDLPAASTPTVYQPVQLGFRDGRNGWLMVRTTPDAAGRDDVVVYLTSDGGYQWQRILAPQTHPDLMKCRKTGLAFPIQFTGWLAGDCDGSPAGLFLYHSTDNGAAWQPVDLPEPTGQAADYLTSATGRCGIPGFVYVSTRSLMFTVRCQTPAGLPVAWLYASGDGGRSWASRALPAAYGSFSFNNPDEGWYLGSDDSSFALGGFLYQTTDGGRSWETVTPVGWSGPINFIDLQNGWVIARVGDREALVQTLNGGRSWVQLKPISIGE